MTIRIEQSRAIEYVRYSNADQQYNFMTPEEYAKFKIELQESQDRAAKTLARISNTLEGVKDTIQQIQQNEENIDNFKKAFGDVMQQLAIKIAGSMGSSPLKKQEGKHYDHLPKQLPIPQLADRIRQQKSILFITGAGVSAPSGIPTFRGKGGLYSKTFNWEGKQYKPEEFITAAFYNQHPQPIWQWTEDIYQMSITCKPNPIHQLIHKLALLLSKRGIKVTLVTQNVDDLHLKPEKKEYHYSAVHGNVRFVRCQNMHLTSYSEVRDKIIKQGSAKCPQCTALVRPHVLFFDQSYGPLYGEDVKSQKFPFAFIIGSSLSTGLCARFAGEAEEKVEINPQPIIEVGKVYQYTKNSQVVLEQILQKLA